LKTGQHLRTFKAHYGHVISSALSQNGQTLATGSYDDTIKVWNLRKGQESCLLVEPELNNDSIAPEGATRKPKAMECKDLSFRDKKR
jgi:WD40 repeat protein